MVASIGRARMRWAGPVLPAAPRERLTLPALPAPAPRAGFPLVATLAPVVVSLVLWSLTQSIYSLLFAVLGPVVAVGGLLDGRVNRRRAARPRPGRFSPRWTRLRRAWRPRTTASGRRLARLSPDPASTIGWAESDGADLRGQPLAVRVGQGTLDGRVDLGGDDPEDGGGAAPRRARARDARRAGRAAELRDAPIVVDARDGIGIIGPPALAAAVARDLAVQLAARLSPSEAALEAPAGRSWARDLPHTVTEGAGARYRLERGRRTADRDLVGGTGRGASGRLRDPDRRRGERQRSRATGSGRTSAMPGPTP